MRRENRKAGERRPIACVIEDAYGSLIGDGYRGNGRLLSGDEDFRPNGQSPGAIVRQPSDRQPIIARSRIAVAVNIDHIARLWVDRRVIYTAQKRVDRAELGCWLCAIRIGNNDT